MYSLCNLIRFASVWMMRIYIQEAQSVLDSLLTMTGSGSSVGLGGESARLRSDRHLCQTGCICNAAFTLCLQSAAEAGMYTLYIIYQPPLLLC